MSRRHARSRTMRWVSGSARSNWWDWALVNTLGVAVRQPGTERGGGFARRARGGEEVGSYYDWDAARGRAQFSPEGLGAAAASEAVRYLGSRPVGTGTRTVIFGPLAAHRLAAGPMHGDQCGGSATQSLLSGRQEGEADRLRGAHPGGRSPGRGRPVVGDCGRRRISARAAHPGGQGRAANLSPQPLHRAQVRGTEHRALHTKRYRLHELAAGAGKEIGARIDRGGRGGAVRGVGAAAAGHRVRGSFPRWWMRALPSSGANSPIR